MPTYSHVNFLLHTVHTETFIAHIALHKAVASRRPHFPQVLARDPPTMPTSFRYDVFLGVFMLLLGLALFMRYTGEKRLPYPPGPKRLPFVGNIFSMPSREEWATYRKWSEEAGMLVILSYCTSPTRPPSGSDVVHADVTGSHIIILNSIKAAHELLDKRSTIYSDRYDPRGCNEAPLCHPLI